MLCWTGYMPAGHSRISCSPERSLTPQTGWRTPRVTGRVGQRRSVARRSAAFPTLSVLSVLSALCAPGEPRRVSCQSGHRPNRSWSGFPSGLGSAETAEEKTCPPREPPVCVDHANSLPGGGGGGGEGNRQMYVLEFREKSMDTG